MIVNGYDIDIPAAITGAGGIPPITANVSGQCVSLSLAGAGTEASPTNISWNDSAGNLFYGVDLWTGPQVDGQDAKINSRVVDGDIVQHVWDPNISYTSAVVTELNNSAEQLSKFGYPDFSNMASSDLACEGGVYLQVKYSSLGTCYSNGRLDEAVLWLKCHIPYSNLSESDEPASWSTWHDWIIDRAAVIKLAPTMASCHWWKTGDYAIRAAHRNEGYGSECYKAQWLEYDEEPEVLKADARHNSSGTICCDTGIGLPLDLRIGYVPNPASEENIGCISMSTGDWLMHDSLYGGGESAEYLQEIAETSYKCCLRFESAQQISQHDYTYSRYRLEDLISTVHVERFAGDVDYTISKKERLSEMNYGISGQSEPCGPLHWFGYKPHIIYDAADGACAECIDSLPPCVYAAEDCSPSTTPSPPTTTSGPVTTTASPPTTPAPATTTSGPVTTTASPPVTTTSGPVTTTSSATSTTSSTPCPEESCYPCLELVFDSPSIYETEYTGVYSSESGEAVMYNYWRSPTKDEIWAKVDDTGKFFASNFYVPDGDSNPCGYEFWRLFDLSQHPTAPRASKYVAQCSETQRGYCPDDVIWSLSGSSFDLDFVSCSTPTTTSSTPTTTSSTPTTTSSTPTTTSSTPTTTSSTPTTTSAAPTTTSAAPTTTSAAPTTTSAAPTTTSAAP
jgi:hypothetical protein